jgi:glycosyltransferase involved in cell wall biosynthesis
MSEPRRVLMLAPIATDNPYLACLIGGLRAAAPELVCELRVGVPLRRWLPVWRGADVIHLHWPEYVYTRADGCVNLRRGLALLVALAGARALGRRVVYTVHNLDPHDGGGSRAQHLLQRQLLRLASVVHVHDRLAAQAIHERYGRAEQICCIPHGSYCGCYPNTVSRAAARAALGLDQRAFVYLHLGQIRRYKGTLELLDAFAELAPRDAALLIAGQPVPPELGALVRARGAGVPGARLALGAVPDERLQHYFNAADVAVLPYRRVTTSGAAALALSFGLPVVAPARGGFVDLVPGRGLLYDPGQAGCLTQALADARRIDLAAARAAALAWSDANSWAALAAAHAAMYRSAS